MFVSICSRNPMTGEEEPYKEELKLIPVRSGGPNPVDLIRLELKQSGESLFVDARELEEAARLLG